MSFAKIAEARAVEKIITLMRGELEQFPTGSYTHFALQKLIAKVEAGKWKEIKLPKKSKAKKK